VQLALRSKSLYEYVLKELLSDDDDCKYLYSQSLKRAGIKTQKPSQLASRGNVNAMMRVLEQSSYFCSRLARFKKTAIDALWSMSALLPRVLERMVRAVAAFRQMS
jgi:hypothetical protein